MRSWRNAAAKYRPYARLRNYWETNRMAQINAKETKDEVLHETRRIKESLAESMAFDIDRVLEDARRKQKESGRTILSPPGAAHA